MTSAVSTYDIVQVTGSVAGLISLVWMIVTQLFGSYESRTIRKMVDSNTKTINDLIKRLES